MYPVRIDGPSLILRELTDEDLDPSMAVVGDPAVTTFLGFPPRTRDEQAVCLAADIARARCRPRPDYYFAAVDRDAGVLVGLVRLGLDPHNHADLGAALRRDSWGRGRGPEAAELMLDFAFHVLRVHRVQASCCADHPASRRVLSKLGFHLEGRLRDHLLVGGAWCDSLLYSLLRPEWHHPSAGKLTAGT